MALIACPECSQLLSDSAPGCPKCGCKLTPEIVAAQKQKKLEAEQKNAKADVKAACIFAAMIVGCVAVFVPIGCYLNSKPAKPEWTPQNLATLRQIEADEHAREMVKSAYDDLSLRWDGTRRPVTVGELSRHLDEDYIDHPSPFEEE